MLGRTRSSCVPGKPYSWLTAFCRGRASSAAEQGMVGDGRMLTTEGYSRANGPVLGGTAGRSRRGATRGHSPRTSAAQWYIR
eukprot:5962006-Pyramimonas_sp.AAC.1